jgi:hypothetical protein
MEIIPVVGIVTSFTAIVLIVYFVTRSRQRRVEVQAEMQGKLIERFGAAPELVEFLHSPAGREFVAGMQSAPGVMTRERILSGFTRSILLTMLGLAFLFLTFFQHERDLIIPAAILFFLGIGYLLATLLSYRLASRLRLSDLTPPATSSEIGHS